MRIIIFFIFIFSCSKSIQLKEQIFSGKFFFDNVEYNYSFQIQNFDSPIFIFINELNEKEQKNFFLEQNYLKLDLENLPDEKNSEILKHFVRSKNLDKFKLILFYNKKDSLLKTISSYLNFINGIIFFDSNLDVSKACIHKNHFYFILGGKSNLADFAERNYYCNSLTKLDFSNEYKNFNFASWLLERNPVKEKIKVNNLSILFFGDSLSISFVWNFSEKFNSDYHFKVDNFGKVSSGLVISTYDWNKEIDKFLENKTYRESFILLGANDDQKIYHGLEIFPFGSDSWNFEYSHRLKKLISKLKEKNIEPNFVLLPTVKDKNRNIRYEQINSIIKKVSEEEKISLIEIDSYIGIENKIYSDKSYLRGKILPMRQKDGIHFIPFGGKKISIPILKIIFSKYEFEK